jgi:hypothetical protein
MELFLFKIDVEKKNGIKREGEREGKRKVVFLSSSQQNASSFFFLLFLDFPVDKKLPKHPPTYNAIVHNKTLSLQTKNFTQILKIEKNCNNIINLQRN